jgi:DNA gyrase subunit A
MARTKRTTTSKAATTAASADAGSEEHASTVVPGREVIDDIDVSAEMSASFIEYAMSVIVARALPDVRDGLKPVHRRILFSLHSQGIRPSSAYKKCARVVGDTMGKYHPHGDSAIYEALVRLAQEWSMRLPLVDGHGNFGSLDDGPAASRYTECRMATTAMAMVEELGEDTVDMRPNYDGNETEPEVLPAAFPNLLVNGSTGIAVGMATNMAPHNLGEVTSGLQAMLANPKITLDEMLTHIPGPDLPSGGIIAGLDGVRDAYETGRGAFAMRAVARVEDVSARRKGIVVTELPYNVGPEKVVARIKELVNAKKLPGVSDIKDYTDRKTGLRLLIECKTGFNPHAVLDELYRLTPLQENFSINNVTLVDGEPQTLGLLALCRHYLNHRLVVTRRRTEFRLRKAEARAHILDGLIVALAAIDEVVALIKSSKDSSAAREKLMKKFDLSTIQADAILEMTLRRLTSLEVTKLKDELRELKKSITDLRRLLGSEKAMKELIGEELEKSSQAFATPRRSRLLKEIPASAVESAALEIPDEPCIVALSVTGVVGRFEPSAFKGRPSKHDVLISQVHTTNRAILGLVTTSGRVARLSVVELPAATSSSRGLKASEVFGLDAGESPLALVDARPGAVVTLVTRQGLVKRVPTSEFPQRLDTRPIIGLKPGDAVVFAESLPTERSEKADVMLVSSDAQLLRFPQNAVTPKGLPAGGMAGMRLNEGAYVIAAGVFEEGIDSVVVTVSDAGAVKVSTASEYPQKGRGGGGVRCHTFRKNESALTAVGIGSPAPVALGASGGVVEYPQARLRRDGSGTPTDTGVSGFGFLRSV